MTIQGRVTLLAFIDEQKKLQGLSDMALLTLAGLSPNLLTNIRKESKRGIHMETMLAIVNALGFDIVPVPARTEP